MAHIRMDTQVSCDRAGIVPKTAAHADTCHGMAGGPGAFIRLDDAEGRFPGQEGLQTGSRLYLAYADAFCVATARRG